MVLMLFFISLIYCFFVGGSRYLCGMSAFVSYVWVVLSCVCSVFVPTPLFASCCYILIEVACGCVFVYVRVVFVMCVFVFVCVWFFLWLI